LGALFDEVVQLRRDESKAAFVTDPTGVLIDDSFSEREAVRESTGIVVADPSMVESFFDDRL
jgi:hypothetical protein